MLTLNSRYAKAINGMQFYLSPKAFSLFFSPRFSAELGHFV